MTEGTAVTGGAGAGRATVLLLHGQPGSAEDWAHVIEAVEGHATVLAIDRPGWNGRAPATGLAGNARAALAALDRAGAERATVVGHSFGGAVACWLALEHPERVERLVLAAPAANRACLLQMDRWLAAPLLGDLASAAALASLGLALAARPLRGRISRELSLEDGYLRTVARRLLSPGAWHAFAAEQRTLVRELPRLDTRLGEITAPTTIVAGELDRVVPLQSLRLLARQIPRAELVMIAGADHLLPLREPQRLAEIILSPGEEDTDLLIEISRKE